MPTTESLEAWLIFQREKLLLAKDAESFTIPQGAALSLLKSHLLRLHPLGEFNHTNCYTGEIESTVSLPTGIEAVSLRAAFEYLGLDWHGVVSKAASIIHWDRNHQFCGHCGHTTQVTPGTYERKCTNCGLPQYPRISPSIIVLIKRGKEVLMARSPHFPKNAYGLIAGFVEAGESIEEAIKREVKEEVSIKIKNLQYFGSQSWPFPDSLMIGFIAEYADGEIIIDHNEIESAGWYRFDNIPAWPGSSISIASKLINHFIQECQNEDHR